MKPFLRLLEHLAKQSPLRLLTAVVIKQNQPWHQRILSMLVEDQHVLAQVTTWCKYARINPECFGCPTGNYGIPSVSEHTHSQTVNILDQLWLVRFPTSSPDLVSVPGWIPWFLAAETTSEWHLYLFCTTMMTITMTTYLSHDTVWPAGY